MRLGTALDVDVDMSVRALFQIMSPQEKEEMFLLLSKEKKETTLFNDYEKITEYLTTRFNSQELELKLKQSGLLPEIF